MVERASSSSRAPPSSPAWRLAVAGADQAVLLVGPGEEGGDAAAEVGDPGRLVGIVADQIPQLLDLLRGPPHRGGGPRRGRRHPEDVAAGAGVSLDQAAVQLLDLGDDVLGVHDPLLGVELVGLRPDQDGDEDRLDQERDGDEGQALLEDRERGVHETRGPTPAECRAWHGPAVRPV